MDKLKKAEAGQPLRDDQEEDSQHTSFKPVDAGVAFTFDIHFESLSHVELGALLWILTKANDSRYRLALGMGKALGMGAISIKPTIYESRRPERYSSLFADEGWAEAEKLLDPSVLTNCEQAFNDYVITHSKEPYKHLEQTLRIQCLLLLLAWEGPLATRTRYMDIGRDVNHPEGVRPGRRGRDSHARDVVNEYSNRLILPLPHQVHPEGVRALGFTMPEPTAPVDGSSPSKAHRGGRPQSGARLQQTSRQTQRSSEPLRTSPPSPQIPPPPAPPSDPKSAALMALLAEVERMRPGDVSNMMRAKVDRLLAQEGPAELRRRVAEAIVTKALYALGQKKAEAQKWYPLIAPLLSDPSTEG